MKIKSLIIVFLLISGKIANAAIRDTVYLDIKKIEITDTTLLKDVQIYVDSLKKIAPTNSLEFKWYLRLNIDRHFNATDTIDMKYTVTYSHVPFNPDDSEQSFPTYYCIVRGIPMIISTDRDAEFSLSTKMVISDAAKERLIDILLPYTPQSDKFSQAVDRRTGKINTFKNYWPEIWRDGEYQLKLSIIKSRKNHYYSTIKKQY